MLGTTNASISRLAYCRSRRASLEFESSRCDAATFPILSVSNNPDLGKKFDDEILPRAKPSRDLSVASGKLVQACYQRVHVVVISKK
jgi:hypothetical protein